MRHSIFQKISAGGQWLSTDETFPSSILGNHRLNLQKICVLRRLNDWCWLPGELAHRFLLQPLLKLSKDSINDFWMNGKECWQWVWVDSVIFDQQQKHQNRNKGWWWWSWSWCSYYYWQLQSTNWPASLGVVDTCLLFHFFQRPIFILISMFIGIVFLWPPFQFHSKTASVFKISDAT